MSPKPGAFERGYFTDKQIRDQVARGFTEVGVVIYTPDWAVSDPKRPHPKSVPRNLDLAWDDPENYWGRFTWQMASQYYWLYERTGPFTWRSREKPAGEA